MTTINGLDQRLKCTDAEANVDAEVNADADVDAAAAAG